MSVDREGEWVGSRGEGEGSGGALRNKIHVERMTVIHVSSHLRGLATDPVSLEESLDDTMDGPSAEYWRQLLSCSLEV